MDALYFEFKDKISQTVRRSYQVIGGFHRRHYFLLFKKSLELFQQPILKQKMAVIMPGS
jgi:hypothetical protein